MFVIFFSLLLFNDSKSLFQKNIQSSYLLFKQFISKIFGSITILLVHYQKYFVKKSSSPAANEKGVPQLNCSTPLISSLFHKDHLFHSMIITCCDHVNIHTTGYGFAGQVGTVPDYRMVTCMPDFIHQFGDLLSHDVVHRNCHKGLFR